METQKQRGLKHFVKGDSRINRSGRPKGFDAFRRKAREIACEMVTDSEGNKMTCIEALLRSWAKSKEPVLQKAFVEYAFGKVPEKLETDMLENKTTLILRYGHERERLENGRDRSQDGRDSI
jgi:hypothetical protein